MGVWVGWGWRETRVERKGGTGRETGPKKEGKREHNWEVSE